MRRAELSSAGREGFLASKYGVEIARTNLINFLAIETPAGLTSLPFDSDSEITIGSGDEAIDLSKDSSAVDLAVAVRAMNRAGTIDRGTIDLVPESNPGWSYQRYTWTAETSTGRSITGWTSAGDGEYTSSGTYVVLFGGAGIDSPAPAPARTEAAAPPAAITTTAVPTSTAVE